MDKITTTIEREWFREIAAKRKRVEYREAKKYWRDRLAQVQVPFLLRLINGMSKTAPEMTVQVIKVVENKRSGEFELHLGGIVNIKNWDSRNERPNTRKRQAAS